MENVSKRKTVTLPASMKKNYSSSARLIVVCGESFPVCRKELVLTRFLSDLMLWDKEATGLDLTQALQYFDDKEPKKTIETDGQETLTFVSPELHVEVQKHVRVKSLGEALTVFRCNRHQSPFVLVVFWGLVTSSSPGAEVNLPRIVKWPLHDGLFDACGFTDFDRRRDRHLTALAIYGDGANTVSPSLECRRDTKDNDVLHRFSVRLLDFFKEAEEEEIRPDPRRGGPLYFQQPTLYVFPSGPGCSSFFGVEEFTMLIDAGYSRRVACWELVRRLERLDVLLVTNHGQNNIHGLRAMLARMLRLRRLEQCSGPEIGCAFMNCRETNDSRVENEKWQSELSAEKDFHLESSSHSRTEVNPAMEAIGAANDLRSLKVRPRPCEASASQSHVCLYRKVGAGSLCLDVLQPDDETLKQYLQQLDTGCIAIDKTSKIPFSELASICAVLHWSPASDKDRLIRILFTGSCPQSAVFKGLAEWREREASTHPYGKTSACAGDFRNEATISKRVTSEGNASVHQITKVVEKNFANKESKATSKTRHGKRIPEPVRGTDVRKNNATKCDSLGTKGKMNAKCKPTGNVSIDTNVKASSNRRASASKGKSLKCKQGTVTTKHGKVTGRDTASVLAAKTDEAKSDINLYKPTDVCQEVEDERNAGKSETVYREEMGDLDKTDSLKYSTVCSETEKDADVCENENDTLTRNYGTIVVDIVEPSVIVIPVIQCMTALEEKGPSSNVPDSKDSALTTALAQSSKREIGDKTDDGETVGNKIEDLSETKLSAEEEKKVEDQFCEANKSETKRGTLMEGGKGKLILPDNKKGSNCQKNHNKEEEGIKNHTKKEERGDSDKKKPIGEDQDKTDGTKSTGKNKEMIVKQKQTNDDDSSTEANRQSFTEKRETDEKQSDKNHNKSQELKSSKGDTENLATEGKRKDEQSKQNCKEKDAIQEHGEQRTSSRTQKHQIVKTEPKLNGVERIDKTKCLSSGSSNCDDNNSIQNNSEKLTTEHKGCTGAEHIHSASDTDKSRSAVDETFDIMDSTLDRADSLDELDPIQKSKNPNRNTIHPHQPPTDEADAGTFNLRDMLGHNGFSSSSLNPFRGMTVTEEQANPVFETLEKPLLKDSVMFVRRDIDEDSLDGDDNFDPKQEWDEPMYLPEPDNPDSGRSKPSPGENSTAGCLTENSNTYPVAEEALRTGKEGIGPAVTLDVPVSCISGVKKLQNCENANLESSGACESSGLTGMFTRYKKILMKHDRTVNSSESEETNATVSKDPPVNNKHPQSKVNTLSQDTELDRRLFGLYEPVYLDLAFIPRGGDPGCVDQEFFKFIRSRYYVLSSNCDDLRILDQLLMAKACWNDDFKVTVVPTHDTRELRDWKTAHTFDLIRLNIDIEEPADGCEINLWGPRTQGFLASCVEFKNSRSSYLRD